MSLFLANCGAGKPASAGGGAPSHAPDAIFYFEADYQALADNAAFTAMTDQSGITGDAAQATSGYRGVNKTGILNGLPILRLDGSDDHYPTATGSLAQFTVSYLIKLDAAQTFIAILLGASATTQYVGFSSLTSPRFRYASSNTAMTGLTLTNWNLLTWTYDGVDLKGYANGSLNVTSTRSAALDINRIGALFVTPPPTNAIKGDLAALMVADKAYDSTELAALHSYYTTKYAL